MKNVPGTELFLNGDVQFTMNINYVGKVDITGYTLVNDDTMGSMWKSYSITPCRKQNVGFSILEGSGTFTAKVMYNEEVIQTFENLKAGTYFQIENMMKGSEYEVMLYCDEEKEYSLGVYYDVEVEE